MSRVEKLRKKMGNQGIDALLITSPYNLRYMSHFTGTTGLAIITLEKAFFVTDFRYTEQAAKQAVGYEIIQNKGPIFEEVAKIARENGIKTLGFEEDFVTFQVFETLENLLSCDLAPVSGLVEALRLIKEPKELATIKKACQISDQAYEYILGVIKPGMTEIEVANELDFYMRKLGATGVSFETIVASGVRSAMPHGVASQKEIVQGDFVTIDFGCYYEDYVSDMTRTFSIGEPGEKLREIYKIVLEAQLKVIDAAKPGITGSQLDKIARDHIASFGYGDAFGHSTGHGIGLEVHESPSIASTSNYALVAGNVITDEPGIYLPGIGGVRIEDDIIITENGNEVICTPSKELIVL